MPTEIKIAIASQNRRTVSPHAGKCAHFWLLDSADGSCRSLLLSPAQLLCQGGDLADHPLRGVDVLLAASAGQALAQRLQQLGITLSLTTESEPQAAARQCHDLHDGQPGAASSRSGMARRTVCLVLRVQKLTDAIAGEIRQRGQYLGRQ
ncbi:NifB/NifX family molybdenum-iron cluster-binding protein [Aquitalea magnusonii]|uniref:NifB/NifX family molybdenum-iron cluster-binding protein n=1 Tax=Aquitalea magnusonii TaxID=332411 RepID=UPI0007503EE9|nr:NifB/NifX family molybdenum-iron cluster-binding protein [Aquitalea magnusonii]